MTAALQSWINKQQARSTWPAWLEAHVVGRPEANGSFMIRTKLGREDVQARVHVGAMVFERKGVAHTCPPADARGLIAQMDEADAPVPPREAKPQTKVSEAVVADRSDDTDEITRAIRRRNADPEPTPSSRTTARPPAKPLARPSAGPGVKLTGKIVPAKGAPPSIEWVGLDRLLVDDTYQRSVDTGPSRALIVRIGREWDWRLCVPLMVSRRDDGLYVIDGQHRLFGARLRKDVPHLPCCISTYDSPADEAAMFVAANRERRAMNRLDDFHAAQAGGNAEAVAVATLIEAVGFSVSRKTGSAAWAPGEVAFTSAIAKARRRHGEEIAREALQLMAEAFPGQRLVVGSSIFTATVGLLSDRPADYTRDRSLAALRTFDMAGWGTFIAKAKGGSDRASALKDMLRAAYDDVGREQAA